MSAGVFSALESARLARSSDGARSKPRALLVALAVLAIALVSGLSMAGVLAAATALRLLLLGLLCVVGWTAVASAIGRFERLEQRGQAGRLSGGAAPLVLERAEQRLELARSFAGHFEPLRRDLRVVAEQRLARRGVRFETDEARQLLGEEAWWLLAEPLATDKFSAGVDDARLERLLGSLEGV